MGFRNISIYVKRKCVHGLHQLIFYDMLMRVFIISSYASESYTISRTSTEPIPVVFLTRTPRTRRRTEYRTLSLQHALPRSKNREDQC